VLALILSSSFEKQAFELENEFTEQDPLKLHNSVAMKNPSIVDLPQILKSRSLLETHLSGRFAAG